MREPQKITIEGVQYVVTPMAPMKSAKLLTKLLKLVGEPIGKLASAKKEEGKSIMDSEVDGKLIGEAIEALTNKVDENEMEAILGRLLLGDLITFAKTGDEKFQKLKDIDAHFDQHGGLAQMFKLAKFVLETNYSSFLKDLVG